MLKRALGGKGNFGMWHIFALIVIVMYVRMIFPRLTPAVVNRIMPTSVWFYYIADALAALLFAHTMMTDTRGPRAVAGLALAWLALSYALRVPYGNEQWFAYDGFAVALLFGAYFA